MAVPPSLTPCGDPELAVIAENRVHIRLVFEERKDIIVLRAWAPATVTDARPFLPYFARASRIHK
ncbi:hypothetical protein OV079_50745 [Nannocystis pusilla]|uniref:Uncharacterized protein n=1 Tax=Nannocystis pusilla TaxID=889268 RepID=A0A9X3J3E3_9BACT|nr:hypothetical protein [Nannocystis pusilla]MCY1013676.1 hypothetical protein [Nannocystis pusilla]